MKKLSWLIAAIGTFLFPAFVFAQISLGGNTLSTDTTILDNGLTTNLTTDTTQSGGTTSSSSDTTTGSGTSGSTNTESTTTSSTTVSNPTAVVSPPAAPSNFIKSSEPTRTSIYLVWQDNSSDETHFVVERKLVGALTWNIIARPQANNSSKFFFTDTIEIRPGTSYTYRVQACKEGSGCSDYALSPIVTTPAELDTTAPTAPTALVGVITPERKVKLTWNHSIDNVGVYKYIIYRDGYLYQSAGTVNEFIDNSAYLCKTYQYYVLAYDAAQNRSGVSNTFILNMPCDTAGSANTQTSSTTTAVSPNQTTDATQVSDQPTTIIDQDLAPPTAPTNLTVVASELTFKVSWTPSTDDKGIRVYRVYRNGSLLMVTPNTSFIDNYIVKGKTFTYYVVAVDVSDKISPISNKAEGLIPLETEIIVEKLSTMKGQITDTEGKPVPKAIIHIWNSEGQNFYSHSDETGSYKFDAPAGNYKLDFFLPPDRPDLIKPAIGFTTLVSGEIRVHVQVIETVKVYEKVVSGTVVYPDSKPVVNARVVAFNRTNNQWVNTQTDNTGSFSLNLSAGTWYLNIKPGDPADLNWLWDQAEKVVVFGDNSTSEIKKISFMVKKAGVRVKIKLVNEASEPISNSAVTIENVSVVNGVKDIQHGKSDSSGYITFWVLPGRYTIRGYSANENLINPDDVSFNFSTEAEQEIVLKFKEKQAARGIIRGSVALSDGTPVDGAKIWGWSEMGQHTKTETDTNGNFYIPTLPNDKWHLGASKVLDGFPFRAAELIVAVGGLSGEANLKLIKPKDQLPPAVQIKETAGNPMVAVVKTGASVYVPSNAASAENAAPNSAVTVSIEADADSPSRADTRVVGNTYDVKVENASGKKIDKFEEELEITLPYTDEMLKTFGVKDDNLEPSYFDEETGVWVRVKDFVINKEKKVVVLKIKHLTRFALVAPADTTPPAAPTKLSYSVKTPGSVTLNWTNPTADFHHTKIYRSETKSSLGTLINDLVTEPKFSESGLKKITYYYTVKAVDAAGNESQSGISATVNAGSTVTVTKIPSGLKQGSTGEAVKLLQQALVKAGSLPSAFTISGKYEKSTTDAVKKFQKSKGLLQTGSVGPQTAAALNKVLGGTTAAVKVTLIPSGLKIGSTGEAVKLLQQVLVKNGFLSSAFVVSGKYEKTTEDGVKKFQKSKGISQVGFVGPQTATALNKLPK